MDPRHPHRCRHEFVDTAEVAAMMDGWTMGLDGWLWMGAWVVALAAMVWLLVRAPSADASRDQPLEVLRSRLARGEITADEFERARRLLDT
jgi:putative membrane protein